MASVPFEYECAKAGAFVMDPNVHQRVGYVTDLDGLGLSKALAKDLTVYCPSNNAPTYAPLGDPVNGKVNVVAVIEKYSWDGGVGDPMQFICYVSQENATQLKALQLQSLKTTSISRLGWWIADYDQEVKVWFEQSFPMSSKLLSGQLRTGSLDVDLNPVVVKDGEDVCATSAFVKWLQRSKWLKAKLPLRITDLPRVERQRGK